MAQSSILQKVLGILTAANLPQPRDTSEEVDRDFILVGESIRTLSVYDDADAMAVEDTSAASETRPGSLGSSLPQIEETSEMIAAEGAAQATADDAMPSAIDATAPQESYTGQLNPTRIYRPANWGLMPKWLQPITLEDYFTMKFAADYEDKTLWADELECSCANWNLSTRKRHERTEILPNGAESTFVADFATYTTSNGPTGGQDFSILEDYTDRVFY